MVDAFIGLGSNLGNRRWHLLQAWSGLGKIRAVEPLVLSSPYCSEPVGMTSVRQFINAVGRLRTSLEPEALLAEMLRIEAGLGRIRGRRDIPEDRTLDLDLLYWGDRICRGPDLVLPHPEIGRRLFVLLPLAEIGPEVIHPVYQKTSVELLEEFMTRQAEKENGAQVRKTAWAADDR